MVAKTVTIVGYATAKEGYVEQTRKASMALVHANRKDDGCVQSSLLVDVKNPNKFLLHEEWESMDHWTRHLQQPHVTAFANIFHECATEFDMQKFFLVEE